MEAAPLTLAHTHARNAALETKRNNPVAASEEHDLAATEFATAASSTHDGEALRILNLLEQHHKRLGQILKSTHTSSAASTQVLPVGSTKSPSERNVASDLTGDPSTEAMGQLPPRLARTSRPNTRDLSTSIASNLASARGIPSNRPNRSSPVAPLVSAQQAGGQIASRGEKTNGHRVAGGRNIAPKANAGNSRPSWAPPPDLTASNVRDVVEGVPPTADAPFQQFYSTFEGLLTKLSAPLAFAGLPLLSSPQSPMPELAKQPSTVRQKASDVLQSSVDYSQLISRAALRAVRNDSPAHNPSESFYVVPTSGGTTSYADIMSRAEREGKSMRDHHRSGSNLSMEDFTDASSQILPSLPQKSSASKVVRRTNEPMYDGKTMEEIALENQALKHLSDTLSKRLHVFEISAQTSSAALAQSIRSLHLSPAATPENSRGKSAHSNSVNMKLSSAPLVLSSERAEAEPMSGVAAVEAQRLNSRISELEAILAKSDTKARKRDEENAKLRDTIGKYREKWDSLKAGARARREKEVKEGRQESRHVRQEDGGGSDSTEPQGVHADELDNKNATSM